MNGYVYILRSKKGRYYIGSTSDIQRRLKQHRSGHTHTTKRFKDFHLVFLQRFDSLKRARSVERRIKSWKRKDFIDKIIQDKVIKIEGV